MHLHQSDESEDEVEPMTGQQLLRDLAIVLFIIVVFSGLAGYWLSRPDQWSDFPASFTPQEPSR